ncbi:MAG: hypothetical protein N838_30060 [Thiohalocapsa sp. PB-PSB1]|nr:MAG: hypothetical protein N838_30060 [Thiohalocapsa sp. PB-PSB1]
MGGLPLREGERASGAPAGLFLSGNIAFVSDVLLEGLLLLARQASA